MVRYVKNEGRPALGFAVESEESDESSDDEPLSDQPSLATLVSENPGSPPDSQAPFVPKSERRRSSARVSFKEDMAFVDRQGYTRDSENLEETVVKVRTSTGSGWSKTQMVRFKWKKSILTTELATFSVSNY